MTSPAHPSALPFPSTKRWTNSRCVVGHGWKNCPDPNISGGCEAYCYIGFGGLSVSDIAHCMQQ